MNLVCNSCEVKKQRIKELESSQAFNLNKTIKCLQEKHEADEKLICYYKEKIKFMEDSCLQCVDADAVSRELKEQRDSAFYWQNLHDRKVTELQVKLDDANELLNQRYIDEKGTVWTIPTPEAYEKVCKRLHGLKTSNELLRIRLRDYKHWISKHRTDRKLKWIDVAITMPKDDVELVVLLMDNGRIDIGYKSSKGYWVSHGFTIVNAVTHWMPLPEMPQIDGGKNNESK